MGMYLANPLITVRGAVLREGGGGGEGRQRGDERARGGEKRGEREDVATHHNVCQAHLASSPSSPMSTFSTYKDSASGCCMGGGGRGPQAAKSQMTQLQV